MCGRRCPNPVDVFVIPWVGTTGISGGTVRDVNRRATLALRQHGVGIGSLCGSPPLCRGFESSGDVKAAAPTWQIRTHGTRAVPWLPPGGWHTHPGKPKYRFLRSIPVDPTTGKADWGVCSEQDDRTRGAKVARTCLTSSPKAREPPWMEPLTPSGSSIATPGCGLGSNARPHSQAGVPVPPPTAENSRPPASSCTLTLPIETHGGRRGWRSLCRAVPKRHLL